MSTALRNHPASRRWLVAVATAAICVLQGAALFAFDSTARGPVLGTDGLEYVRYASNLAERGVFSNAAGNPIDPSVERTPGFPAFIAFVRLISASPVVFRVAQLILLFGLAILIYRLAISMSGRVEAAVAAFITCTYLPFVWNVRYHQTELLSGLLLIATILLARRACAERSLRLLGGLCAAMAYVRPNFAVVAVPLIVLVMHSWHGRPTDRVKSGGVVVLTLALTLAPWTVRNLHVSGDVVPLGSNSGASLLASAYQYDDQLSLRFERQEFLDFGARIREFRLQVIQWPSADSPAKPDLERLTLLRSQIWRASRWPPTTS